MATTIDGVHQLQIRNAANGDFDINLTVQDESLSYSKFIKGTMGYVIPQQFGAKGDGVTDDTQALKNCIDYAMANNYAVYVPMGTYIVVSSVLQFSPADGQSLVVVGNGQNTIIKRKANSLNGRWSQIFTITPQPVNAHANDVVFSNFCIDSNRRGQGEIASDSYDYEASADISIRNGDNLTDDEQYLDRFIVSNMRFYDPVADCVNVSGSGQLKVRDVFIDRIVATDRHGTRNDIGITGNPLHFVHITNCDCDTIHFEYNQTPTDEQIIPYIISDCRFGLCTLGAQIDLLMTSCVITDAFLISGFRTAKVFGCDIVLSEPYTVFSANGTCDFDNCLFRLPYSEDTTKTKFFYVRETLSCLIHNCEFKYVGNIFNLDLDGDENMEHVKGKGISVIQGMQNPVIIDNCRFDSRLQYCFIHRNNNIIFKNERVKTAYVCSHNTPNTTTLGAKMVFDNVRLESDCLGPLDWGNIPVSQEVDGKIKTLPSNFQHTQLSATYRDNWYANVTGNYHREVIINEPLTLTTLKSIASYQGYQHRCFFDLIKGDTFVYEGDNPQLYPKKWVIMDDGNTTLTAQDVLFSGTALEDRIISIGSGYGDTASRPTCYLSKGFMYYDTTLGKPIYWNGTTWVDDAGTAV